MPLVPSTYPLDWTLPSFDDEAPRPLGYVRGFDHFCEFVGNDIGRGNLGCFVAFLVLLSTLATYVVLIG